MTKTKRTATKKTNSKKKAAHAVKTAAGAPQETVEAKAAATTPRRGAQAAQEAPKGKAATKKATAKKAGTTAKDGATPPKPKGAREGSKKAQVLDMIRRPDGASLKEIMDATGWQPHTVRGFMAGTVKKMGIQVESFKRDDERAYAVRVRS